MNQDQLKQQGVAEVNFYVTPKPIKLMNRFKAYRQQLRKMETALPFDHDIIDCQIRDMLAIGACYLSELVSLELRKTVQT